MNRFNKLASLVLASSAIYLTAHARGEVFKLGTSDMADTSNQALVTSSGGLVPSQGGFTGVSTAQDSNLNNALVFPTEVFQANKYGAAVIAQDNYESGVMTLPTRSKGALVDVVVGGKATLCPVPEQYRGFTVMGISPAIIGFRGEVEKYGLQLTKLMSFKDGETYQDVYVNPCRGYMNFKGSMQYYVVDSSATVDVKNMNKELQLVMLGTEGADLLKAEMKNAITSRQLQESEIFPYIYEHEMTYQDYVELKPYLTHAHKLSIFMRNLREFANGIKVRDPGTLQMVTELAQDVLELCQVSARDNTTQQPIKQDLPAKTNRFAAGNVAAKQSKTSTNSHSTSASKTYFDGFVNKLETLSNENFGGNGQPLILKLREIAERA